MISGSCLCGAVRYELSETPIELCHCHCSMCRKAHGAAYASFARIEASTLRFTAGEEKMTRFRSSPPVQRCFCPSCGSPIGFLYDEMPEAAWLVAGTLDDDPVIRPSSHIFVADKAPWHEITDELQQYQEYP